MPAVFLIYDLYPISIAISDSRRSIAHFLVRVCAVLGGVFAVTGVGNATFLPLHAHIMVLSQPADAIAKRLSHIALPLAGMVDRFVHRFILPLLQPPRPQLRPSLRGLS